MTTIVATIRAQTNKVFAVAYECAPQSPRSFLIPGAAGIAPRQGAVFFRVSWQYVMLTTPCEENVNVLKLESGRHHLSIGQRRNLDSGTHFRGQFQEFPSDSNL